MPLLSKPLHEQEANGVPLFVDGYAITQHEIKASAHVLPCCRSSGFPCAPPNPSLLQTSGYTTPDLPSNILRRIRVLRHGCTRPRRSDWTDPPCAAPHPIKDGEARHYVRHDDPSCQTLRQSGWGSKKQSEARAVPVADRPLPSIVEAPGAASAQTQAVPQVVVADSNASANLDHHLGQPDPDLVRSFCNFVTSLGRFLSALNADPKEPVPSPVPGPSTQTAAVADRSALQADTSTMAAASANKGNIPVPAPPMQGGSSSSNTNEDLAGLLQGFDLGPWMLHRPPTD